MSPTPLLMNPQAIAERGEAIYREKYLEAFERNHHGEFVAIDVQTGQAYLGDDPETALERAGRAAPKGTFHLIRVGFQGAFRVSHTSPATALDWVFR